MRREILRYLWPYRIPFTIALCQVFLISAFEILKPWPLKVVIDNVLSGKPLTWTFAASYSTETILFLSCLSLVLLSLAIPKETEDGEHPPEAPPGGVRRIP